jgi:hypothetical protein
MRTTALAVENSVLPLDCTVALEVAAAEEDSRADAMIRGVFSNIESWPSLLRQWLTKRF